MIMIVMFFLRSFRATVAALGAIALLATAGCSSSASQDGSDADSTTNIVVGAYPFEYIASQVAGDHATVTNLLAPGADSHDLELSPRQIGQVSAADLVIYQSGLQAPMDQAIEQQTPTHVLDTATFLKLRPATAAADDQDSHQIDPDRYDPGAYDPHVWLDPTNMVEIANQTAAVLSQIQPENADDFAANAAHLNSRLADLDSQFTSGLSNCARTTFITNHAAFGYLASRYGLEQVGISGLSPDEEPSPARIAQVQQIAKDNGVTTIFYETAVSPKVAQTIASDLGLSTDVLDPIETLSPESRGNDYLEVMSSNLDSLQKANGCE